MATREGDWEPLRNTIYAAQVLLGHVVIALLFIVGFWVFEMGWSFAFAHENPMLFDKVPLKYVFHCADLIVLVVLLSFGVVETVRRLRGP